MQTYFRTAVRHEIRASIAVALILVANATLRRKLVRVQKFAILRTF